MNSAPWLFRQQQAQSQAQAHQAVVAGGAGGSDDVRGGTNDFGGDQRGAASLSSGGAAAAAAAAAVGALLELRRRACSASGGGVAVGSAGASFGTGSNAPNTNFSISAPGSAATAPPPKGAAALALAVVTPPSAKKSLLPLSQPLLLRPSLPQPQSQQQRGRKEPQNAAAAAASNAPAAAEAPPKFAQQPSPTVVAAPPPLVPPLVRLPEQHRHQHQQPAQPHGPFHCSRPPPPPPSLATLPQASPQPLPPRPPATATAGASHQVTGTPGSHRTTATASATILPAAAAPAPERASYHVMALRRPSLQVPWGLNLAMMRDGRYLVVVGGGGGGGRMSPPDADTGSSVSVGGTSWNVGGGGGSAATLTVQEHAWLASAWWPASRPQNGAGACGSGGGGGGVHAQMRHLLDRCGRQASPGVSAATSQPRLYAGDCIVAVNGMSVRGSGAFRSLSDVTSVFRSSLEVCVVVLRIPAAIVTARIQRYQLLPHHHHHQQQQQQQQPQQQLPQSSVVYYNNACFVAALAASKDVEEFAATVIAQGRATATNAQNPPPTTKASTASTAQRKTKRPSALPDPYTNPMFRDAGGRPVPYSDNWEFDPDEGQRARLFVRPVRDFGEWLCCRKRKWRAECYKVYPAEPVVEDLSYREKKKRKRKDGGCCGEERIDQHADRNDVADAVPVDFWSRQGYGSFQEWLSSSSVRWRRDYSWNRRKRQKLEQDAHNVKVHLPLHHYHRGACSGDDFREWLRVRKSQWKIQRRKRQRERRQQELVENGEGGEDASSPEDDHGDHDAHLSPDALVTNLLCSPSHQQQGDLIAIDAMLEEEERLRRAREDRPPLDVSFLFDAGLRCPDDVVVHILRYMDRMEYTKLLCISRDTRAGLSKREAVWKQLCPPHWKLPRRPRKPWHELYFKHLRNETESASKRWDDLLTKVSNKLLRGDQLQAIQKLVQKAERDFNFEIDYSSGVVCERNSILNLAVIHQRHKVVKWLVETKRADIETFDRGQFTPLLNAAYAGDRHLVRFLLQHGADRKKVGLYHYTKGVCAHDFKGMTAAGWAEEKGFPDLAKLIQIGL